nr:hypothetical protein GCM10020092_037970 [Actinoplanes digitatis]
MLTDDFERRLIEHIQPVRQFFLAQALHHALDLGVLAALADDPGQQSDDLAKRLGLDPVRTATLLRYLRNEGYTVHESGGWSLSAKGREVRTFAPWYEMLVGGYAPTMEQLGDVLRDGTRYASRNTTKVGAEQLRHRRLRRAAPCRAAAERRRRPAAHHRRPGLRRRQLPDGPAGGPARSARHRRRTEPGLDRARRAPAGRAGPGGPDAAGPGRGDRRPGARPARRRAGRLLHDRVRVAGVHAAGRAGGGRGAAG